ncbi:permease-like cell division protein FtsX [Embleya sp. NPDC005575]|uniref:permease-like cell division protein FtsX n=1 Tax=Embleya sp. NPDC005575 TaxID=3156892 RepID=UPI0033BE6AA8
MAKRITFCVAGRVAVGCATALLSITTVAACSGDGGKLPPRQTRGTESPRSPGSGEATEEAPAWSMDNLPPGVDFWAGKVDLAVFLCHVSDAKTGGCSAGAVTGTQRDEIRTALQAMPQVKHVYFEDRRQAWELFRVQNGNTPLVEAMTAEQLPESFRVKLKDPGTVAAVKSAFDGRPGVASTMTQTPSGLPTGPGNPAAPPRTGMAAPLTPDRARRAVLTVDDVGPGWSAGALTDTEPKPAAAPYSGSSGDAGCDRALQSVPTGPTRVALGADRIFEQDRTGTQLVASVQVYEGDGAAVQLAKSRAMVTGCADLDLPWNGGTARFRAIAAPTVGEEAVGMRIVVNQGGGPKAVDSILVRMGPNVATVSVLGDVDVDPTALDRLVRRAAEYLHTAVRN